MSFDDLQFSGLGPSKIVQQFCTECRRTVDFDLYHNKCIPGGHIQVTADAAGSLLHHYINRELNTESTSADENTNNNSEESDSAPEPQFIDFASILRQMLGSQANGPNQNMLDMIQAQQNVDVDQLINSLLQNPDYNSGAATSKDFIATLKPIKLTKTT